MKVSTRRRARPVKLYVPRPQLDGQPLGARAYLRDDARSPAFSGWIAGETPGLLPLAEKKDLAAAP